MFANAPAADSFFVYFPSGPPSLPDTHVMSCLDDFQEAVGLPLAQLTPVSVEIKALLEQEILL